MNSFEGDTADTGAGPERERFLQPVAGGQRVTVMLAAFEGWNDAGEAASDSLRYLNKLWGGKKVASIDADEYYDFQFTRPTVRRNSSGERKVKWPSTRIYKASAPDCNVDVIFVLGTEPSYKWRAYTTELLVHAEALERGLRGAGGGVAGRRATQPAHTGEHDDRGQLLAGAPEPGSVAV